MKKLFTNQSLSIGLALFSMFFGAGNIIYPLAIGQYAGDKNFYAMAGLLLTAAIMPIAGVIAMLLFNGDYRQFFGRLGKVPGFLLAFTTIALLGPLGSTPRCIALAYTTLKDVIPISLPLFSAAACGIIFLFTIRKNYITLLGWVLTPLLLASLVTIIVMGLLNAPEAHSPEGTHASMFLYGLREGYNTMDLLAAFFFSSTVLHLMKQRLKSNGQESSPFMAIMMGASIIGAILLSLIYVGFGSLASYHGQNLNIAGKDGLLAAITMKIAGAHAGMLVCVTIALACFTTAIALITAFTDFMQQEVFDNKVSYRAILAGSLTLTFFVSTFDFTGISAFLWPVLQICYPGLIVLTFLNIAYRLMDFTPVKVPVFLAFTVSAIVYFYGV